MGKVVKSMVNLVALGWDEDYKKKIHNAKKDEGVIHLENVPYLEDGTEAHKTDIFIPENSQQNHKIPIMVDVHGGGFISGDKEMDRIFSSYLSSKGMLVYSVNYQIALNDGIDVFDEIKDLIKAIAFIKKDAASRNGDTDGVYLSGHSAGAVLVLALALLSKSEELRKSFDAEDFSLNVKGVFLDCGFMQFDRSELPFWGVRITVFPKGYKEDERYKALLMKDNRYYSLLPPCFVLTNKNDPLRPMSESFVRELDKSGVRYMINERGREGHMGIIYTPSNRLNRLTIKEMLRFFGLKEAC